MPLIQRAARYLGAILVVSGLLSAAPALADDVVASRSAAVGAALPLSSAVMQTATQPKPAFASLADAVAAQDRSIGEEDLRCLAGAVYFESRGQPLAGQLAVAQVILNRIHSGRFAADVCGVVLQRGQFGFVRGGAIPAVDPDRADYRTALAVAKVALGEAWEQTAAGALYFNGVRAARPGGHRVAVIGGHAFYR